MRSLGPVVAALFLFAASIATADEAVSAREHYRRGTNAFNLGHYLEAVKEYEAAYQQKEDPALLFNIAQAYRLGGDDEAAVRVYKSYLHQVPDSPQRAEVESRIVELQALIEQQRKTKEAPPEGTLPPKPQATTESPTPTPAIATAPIQVEARKPWYKDAGAMTMASMGVAALGVGIGLAVVGNLDLSRATTAADLQDHDNLRSTGTTLSVVGYVSLGVGAALCTAAAIKWSLGRKRNHVAMGVGVSGSAAAVTIGGSY